MALGWKLVIDSADPHRQAAFWAAALEYELEDNSPLIEQLLAAGHIDDSLVVEIDGRRYWWSAAGARHPDDPFDPVSGSGLGRRLLFQKVPEEKSVKNRLHIDVHSGTAGREVTVARLVALGARFVEQVEEQSGSWTVLTDPEGNEFCVA